VKALTKRLLRLDARFGSLMKPERTVAPSGAQIAKWLDSVGVVREPNECLAETMCRATGWSMAELRAALIRRALGMSV
jgi:hypothetical protein